MNGFRFFRAAPALVLATLLTGCAATADNTAPGDSSEKGILPLAITWGASGEGYGRLAWNAPHETGSFQFQLHDRRRESKVSTTFVNRCYGHWEAQESFSREGAVAVAGTWRVHCASGRIAEGRFSADESGNGIGEGFDRNGRLVRLAFGVADVEAEETPEAE